MNTDPLIIQHGGPRVAPGSGFFSCCSVKLYHIVEYFNNNEYLQTYNSGMSLYNSIQKTHNTLLRLGCNSFNYHYEIK